MSSSVFSIFVMQCPLTICISADLSLRVESLHAETHLIYLEGSQLVNYNSNAKMFAVKILEKLILQNFYSQIIY